MRAHFALQERAGQPGNGTANAKSCVTRYGQLYVQSEQKPHGQTKHNDKGTAKFSGLKMAVWTDKAHIVWIARE